MSKYSDLFENYWLKYGAAERLKTSSKGTKHTAHEAWKKVGLKWCVSEGMKTFDEKEFSRTVSNGLIAYEKNRKQARIANEHVPFYKHASTWLNQFGFEVEFDTSTSEYRSEAPPDRVCACGNTNNIIGRTEMLGWVCRACDLKKWEEKNTLAPLVAKHPRKSGESWTDWSRRVLATMPAGAKLLNRIGVTL